MYLLDFYPDFALTLGDSMYQVAGWVLVSLIVYTLAASLHQQRYASFRKANGTSRVFFNLACIVKLYRKVKKCFDAAKRRKQLVQRIMARKLARIPSDSDIGGTERKPARSRLSIPDDDSVTLASAGNQKGVKKKRKARNCTPSRDLTDDTPVGAERAERQRPVPIAKKMTKSRSAPTTEPSSPSDEKFQAEESSEQEISLSRFARKLSGIMFRVRAAPEAKTNNTGLCVYQSTCSASQDFTTAGSSGANNTGSSVQQKACEYRERGESAESYAKSAVVAQSKALTRREPENANTNPGPVAQSKPFGRREPDKANTNPDPITQSKPSGRREPVNADDNPAPIASSKAFTPQNLIAKTDITKDGAKLQWPGNVQETTCRDYVPGSQPASPRANNAGLLVTLGNAEAPSNTPLCFVSLPKQRRPPSPLTTTASVESLTYDTSLISPSCVLSTETLPSPEGSTQMTPQRFAMIPAEDGEAQSNAAREDIALTPAGDPFVLASVDGQVAAPSLRVELVNPVVLTSADGQVTDPSAWEDPASLFAWTPASGQVADPSACVDPASLFAWASAIGQASRPSACEDPTSIFAWMSTDSQVAVPSAREDPASPFVQTPANGRAMAPCGCTNPACHQNQANDPVSPYTVAFPTHSLNPMLGEKHPGSLSLVELISPGSPPYGYTTSPYSARYSYPASDSSYAYNTQVFAADNTTPFPYGTAYSEAGLLSYSANSTPLDPGRSPYSYSLSPMQSTEICTDPIVTSFARGSSNAVDTLLAAGRESFTMDSGRQRSPSLSSVMYRERSCADEASPNCVSRQDNLALARFLAPAQLDQATPGLKLSLMSMVDVVPPPGLGRSSSRIELQLESCLTPLSVEEDEDSILGGQDQETLASLYKASLKEFFEGTDDEPMTTLSLPFTTKESKRDPSWSLGAEKHFDGQCQPCGFYYKKMCRNGSLCVYCHMCPRTELKRRKKDKMCGLRGVAYRRDVLR